MKHIGIILLLFLTALLLSSCFDSDSSDHHHHSDSIGFLKIINNTNAPITVTWTADNSENVVDANSYTIFEFDTKNSITGLKSISTTYVCDGLYFHLSTFTDTINLGQTTTRALYPDRGCVKFINNTAGEITVTIPGLADPLLIDSYSSYTQAWLIPGSSAVATFSYWGEFVFGNAANVNVFLNATSTYPISPSGAAIKITNYSPYSITEVYLSPHTDSNWGDNDLYGTISPGHYVSWTAMPNTWDVKVIDENGNFATWTDNNYIFLNQMLIINYPPAKQNIDISGKIAGHGTEHEGLFRIQQVK
jgi:hypothetical protein